MELNLVDILLVLVILLSMVYGWQRGFILGLLDLLRWAGSLLLALRFYQPVARWLGSHIAWPEFWVRPVAFMLLATLAGIGIHLLGYALLRRLPKDIHRRRTNRVFGLLPGFLSGLVTAAILAPLLLALPLPEGLRDSTRESAVANRLAVITERLETSLTPVFDEATRRTLNMLTVRPEPESGESVKLPFTVNYARARPDLEARMLALVNEERAKAGLKPLSPDPELTEVARHHSTDMFERGYFAHVSPEGHSPFDRMREAGVTFIIAGENLALAPTLSIAHHGLMNSPGHRANILRPQYGRLGIGVMDGGVRGLMVSQEFRN
ncbi:MAG TPA: CvpA family protein [Pyrinomonadaceae bacterium]|jgi:uncharacterized protein YkwD